MSKAAADLRQHLITMHGFDWSNEAIQMRDLEGMRVMHAEDHRDLSAAGGSMLHIPDHPEGSRKKGTLMRDKEQA